MEIMPSLILTNRSSNCLSLWSITYVLKLGLGAYINIVDVQEVILGLSLKLTEIRLAMGLMKC